MDSIFGAARFIGYSYHTHNVPDEIRSATLSYLELTYVIDGQMTYFLDGEELTLTSGDAIVIPQGHTRYRPEHTEEVYYASFNIMMDGEVEARLSGVINNAVRSDTVLMLESADKSVRSVSHNRQERIVAIFLYLYHQLLDHSVDRENEHIKKIKKYVLKHICEDVSLDEIASEVHLVPRYVCTLFKRETGMTITEYMVGEKIELAKRLIIMRRQTLTEIAETCGFSDYNYFSRVFKRIVGMTPGEYRKSVSRS